MASSPASTPASPGRNSMSTPSLALRPCPFCGESDALSITVSIHGKTPSFVSCENEQCEVLGPSSHDGESGAIVAWNTRTQG